MHPAPQTPPPHPAQSVHDGRRPPPQPKRSRKRAPATPELRPSRASSRAWRASGRRRGPARSACRSARWGPWPRPARGRAAGRGRPGDGVAPRGRERRRVSENPRLPVTRTATRSSLERLKRTELARLACSPRSLARPIRGGSLLVAREALLGQAVRGVVRPLAEVVEELADELVVAERRLAAALGVQRPGAGVEGGDGGRAARSPFAYSARAVLLGPRSARSRRPVIACRLPLRMRSAGLNEYMR